MSGELATAVKVRANMGPADAAAADQLVADLGGVKRQIEERAAALGYAGRCRRAIPVCRGECCRWHFPRTIDRVDLFIAVAGLSSDEMTAVVAQVRSAADRPYQCPLLRADGCIFAFEKRPVVCTSAYPCVAGSDYWRYKETFRREIDTIRAALGRLMERC